MSMLIAGSIKKVNAAVQKVDRRIAAEETKKVGLVLARGCLQGICSHTWKFKAQWNAYHEHFWIVQYTCETCEAERKERKIPVCETCDCALVRCGPEDVTAEKERLKPEHQGRMNSPLAFRCPQCRTIHILWHQGD